MIRKYVIIRDGLDSKQLNNVNKKFLLIVIIRNT